jgi:hypothetical protein
MITDICSIVHLYKHPGIVIGNSKGIFDIGGYITSNTTNGELLQIRQLLIQRINDCHCVIVDLSKNDKYARSICIVLFGDLTNSTQKTIEQLRQIMIFKHDTNPTIQQIVSNYLS